MRFIILFFLLIVFFPAHSQFTPAGVIGSERLGLVQLNRPTAATIGTDGLLYFINEYSDEILVYEPNGAFVKSISTIFNGVPFRPHSIDINNDGLIYISSSTLYTIAILDDQGNLLQQIGSFGSGQDQFNWPRIALDENGNIWVADYGNNRVKKLSESGVFISEFPSLGPLYIDVTSNAVYVYEYNLSSIKKYSLSGVLLDEMQFPGQLITGLVVESEDNLFVATFVNGVFACDFVSNSSTPIPEPQNDYEMIPGGLALQGDNLFIPDLMHRFFVYHVSINSLEVFIASNGDGQFNAPVQMAKDQNQNVYVTDANNHRIQVFDSDGNFIRKFGSFGSGNGELGFPQDIAIDSNGDCYVLNNNGVSVFNDQGIFLRQFYVNGYGGIAVDENYVYIAGSLQKGLQRLDKNGVFQEMIIEGGAEPGKIDGLKDFVIDEAGNFYVAELVASRVQIFNNDGDLLQVLGEEGKEEGEFYYPVGIERDNQGRIYVIDSAIISGGRTQIFNQDGNLMTILRLKNTIYPHGVIVNSDGRVFVSDAGHHRIQIFDGDLDILEEPDIEVQVPIVTYGDPDFQLDVNSNSDGALQFKVPDDAPIEITNNGVITVLGAGQVSIKITQSRTPQFIQGVYIVSLEISKANLRVVAYDWSKTYGDANPEFTIQYQGFKNDDTISDIDTPPQINTSANSTSSVGTYSIELEGALDNNYDFEYVPGQLKIEKALLNVTLGNASRNYGYENLVLTVQYDGFVNHDKISDLDTPPTINTTAGVASPVGEYPINANGASDHNYDFAYLSGILTINKAPLTAKAEDKSKQYNTPNPELTIEYVGFRNNEDASDLPIGPTISTNATQSSPIGIYAIELTGGAATNYELTLFSGQLTIAKANQQISFGSLPSTMFNTLPPFALQANSDSGLPVNYNVSSGPAYVVAGVVTLSTDLGTVTIEATQPGNDNYFAASPVSRSFEVILDPVLGVDGELGNINAYPNPANDKLFIKSQSIQITEFVLIDSKGTKINLNVQNVNEGFLIDVSALSNGLYVLRLKTNLGQDLLKKIIVRR